MIGTDSSTLLSMSSFQQKFLFPLFVSVGVLAIGSIGTSVWVIVNDHFLVKDTQKCITEIKSDLKEIKEGYVTGKDFNSYQILQSEQHGNMKKDIDRIDNDVKNLKSIIKNGDLTMNP